MSDERDPDSAYRRLPRVNQLRSRPRAIARELAAWRETTAESEDRPVGAVLPDVALVEIAKRQPATLQELERIRGIRPDTGRRRGKQIIEAVERGREGEPPPAEEVQRTEIDTRDAAGDLAGRVARALARAGRRASRTSWWPRVRTFRRS